MISRILIFAVLVLLCVPAVSVAHDGIHVDIEAAHAYWQTGTAVPEPTDANGNVCRTHWQITPDTPEHTGTRGGAMTGMAFTYNPTSGTYADANGRWDWYIAECVFTVNPTFQGGIRRCAIVHEIGHAIHGPSHTGPMSPEALYNSPGCAPEAPVFTHTTPRISRYSRAMDRIRRSLPGWRASCTPSNAVMRCRATRGRSVRRYRVRVTASEVFVRNISDRRAS